MIKVYSSTCMMFSCYSIGYICRSYIDVTKNTLVNQIFVRTKFCISDVFVCFEGPLISLR